MLLVLHTAAACLILNAWILKDGVSRTAKFVVARS